MRDTSIFEPLISGDNFNIDPIPRGIIMPGVATPDIVESLTKELLYNIVGAGYDGIIVGGRPDFVIYNYIIGSYLGLSVYVLRLSRKKNSIEPTYEFIALDRMNDPNKVTKEVMKNEPKEEGVSF